MKPHTTIWGIHAGKILTHYEKFDSRYKGILPLRRVYVPDPEEETEE
jgi:hypothetical protein